MNVTSQHRKCRKKVAGAIGVFPRWQTQLLTALLVSVILLSGCGLSSSSQSTDSGSIAGNWQFTNFASPGDGSFSGGLQGGFLLQKGSSVQGQIVYSISSPNAVQNPCSAGTAAVTGSATGQKVSLVAIAGVETFKLDGTLSQDGKTVSGTYSSTDGQGCGTAQSGLQWTAVLVAPISGTIQGSLHSTGGGNQTSLTNQVFLVTGFLQQGPNVGASSAIVSGTLNFQGYPCVSSAFVSGQVSGNSVVLQMIGSNGLNIGEIGGPPGRLNPVLVSGSSNGNALRGSNAYAVSTKACPGANLPGDEGNICLGVGATNNVCAQPISLTPAAISFPVQMLGTIPTTQSITVTNTDPAGATLSGLALTFRDNSGSASFPVSDFNGLPSFTEQDNCATSPGSPFSLGPQQSCTVSITFSPQQSCPWLPTTVAPSQCPPFLAASVPAPPAQTAIISVVSPNSADTDTTFVVPISGIGLSLLQPSTPELDFGAEAVGQSSLPQSLSFTNQGLSPIQILPSSSGACISPLPRPLVPGAASGLQVVIGNLLSSFGSTITYSCDVDSVTSKPNFKIVTDSCSGAVLSPLQSCDVSIMFTPQPGTPLSPALDYFLQLNTLQCTSTTTLNCEIDSGRFPVELRANLPSPLRMNPGAGLDFGIQPKGQISPAMTITLTNDPNDPNSTVINFTGNLVKGSFEESDNCGTSLAPGGSCNMAVTFKPQSVGYSRGSITITYNGGQTQTIELRGSGQ
jgi:HYDIN/CFA65/VesB family protein